MNFFRAATLGICTFVASQAQAVVVTSAFNGGWFDPDSSGQGFTFEWVDNFGTPELLVYFGTFDVDGAPTTLVAQGPIDGRNTLNLTLFRPVIEGVSVTPGVFPRPRLLASGSMKITMFGCQDGQVDVNVVPRPGVLGTPSKIRVGTGSFKIRRLYLTNLDSQRCTGGVVDDNPRLPPRGFRTFYGDNQIKARVEYEVSTERAELEFDLRRLAPGQYRLRVDGDNVAEFTVPPPVGGESRVRLRFASPARADAPLLDYDPSQRRIDIQQVANGQIRTSFRTANDLIPLDQLNGQLSPEVNLASVVASEQRAGPDSFRVGFGIESELIIIESELRRIQSETELELRIEGAPEGTFDVFVAGIQRGKLVVTRTATGSYGEISFSNQVRGGSYPLDFEPREASFKFLQNQQEVFTYTTQR